MGVRVALLLGTGGAVLVGLVGLPAAAQDFAPAPTLVLPSLHERPDPAASGDAPADVTPARRAEPSRTRVRVHLMSARSDPGPVLFARSPTGWDEVCSLPCDRMMPTGTWSLALRGPEEPGEPTPIDPETVFFNRDGDLVVQYVDRSGGRSAGALVMALGLILAGALGGGMLAVYANWEPPSGFLVIDFSGALYAFLSALGFVAGTALTLTGVGLLAGRDTARAVLRDPISGHPGLAEPPAYVPDSEP